MFQQTDHLYYYLMKGCVNLNCKKSHLNNIIKVNRLLVCKNPFLKLYILLLSILSDKKI